MFEGRLEMNSKANKYFDITQILRHKMWILLSQQLLLSLKNLSMV